MVGKSAIASPVAFEEDFQVANHGCFQRMDFAGGNGRGSGPGSGLVPPTQRLEIQTLTSPSAAAVGPKLGQRVRRRRGDLLRVTEARSPVSSLLPSNRITRSVPSVCWRNDIARSSECRTRTAATRSEVDSRGGVSSLPVRAPPSDRHVRERDGCAHRGSQPLRSRGLGWRPRSTAHRVPQQQP